MTRVPRRQCRLTARLTRLTRPRCRRRRRMRTARPRPSSTHSVARDRINHRQSNAVTRATTTTSLDKRTGSYRERATWRPNFISARGRIWRCTDRRASRSHRSHLHSSLSWSALDARLALAVAVARSLARSLDAGAVLLTSTLQPPYPMTTQMRRLCDQYRGSETVANDCWLICNTAIWSLVYAALVVTSPTAPNDPSLDSTPRPNRNYSVTVPSRGDIEHRECSFYKIDWSTASWCRVVNCRLSLELRNDRSAPWRTKRRSVAL